MFSNLFEKIHILQNLYIKNKCFLKKKSYSMDGEDIEIFNYFKNKKNGFYVDVGAYHPIQRNNTMLLYLNGWEGINIDISDFSIKLFNHLRSRDSNLNLAISNKEGNVEMFYQKNYLNFQLLKKSMLIKVFREILKQRRLIQKL